MCPYPRSCRVQLALLILISILIFTSSLISKYEVPYAEVPFRAFASLQTTPKSAFHHNRLTPSSNDAVSTIEGLISQGRQRYDQLHAQEPTSVHNAAELYRKRRGRHPPPRFDQWYHYSKARGAVVSEEIFDRIYQDLNIFWALEPAFLRNASATWEYNIGVRNGNLTTKEDDRYRMKLWHEMLSEIAVHLPDVDMAFSIMDEPRLFVPWEKKEELLSTANTRARIDQDRKRDFSRHIPKADFPSLPDYASDPRSKPDVPFSAEENIWTMTQQACPPTSRARRWTDADMSAFEANVTLGGFVSDWTVSKSPCNQPHLSRYHATFLEPLSISASKQLFPVFSGSKISGGVNDDILMPAPRYWETDPKFLGGFDWYAWSRKTSLAFWRGVASGGRNRENTWQQFQRHRFLRLNNASVVAPLLEGAEHETNRSSRSMISRLPLDSAIDTLSSVVGSEAETKRNLVTWLRSKTDMAFVDLLAYPEDATYASSNFDKAPEVRMTYMYTHKYLPDVDGNSFSGRFRALLFSGSLPIKATIYDEWHDSRLVPWIHFVPTNNLFTDFWALLAYFAGFGEQKEHNVQARAIAEEGRRWAKKVLRKEDLLVYVYRLVLEFARISSDEREELMWTEDLH